MVCCFHFDTYYIIQTVSDVERSSASRAAASPGAGAFAHDRRLGCGLMAMQRYLCHRRPILRYVAATFEGGKGQVAQEVEGGSAGQEATAFGRDPG